MDMKVDSEPVVPVAGAAPTAADLGIPPAAVPMALSRPRREIKKPVDLYVDKNRKGITKLVQADYKKDLVKELTQWKDAYAAARPDIYWPPLTVADTLPLVQHEHTRISQLLHVELGLSEGGHDTSSSSSEEYEKDGEWHEGDPEWWREEDGEEDDDEEDDDEEDDDEGEEDDEEDEEDDDNDDSDEDDEDESALEEEGEEHVRPFKRTRAETQADLASESNISEKTASTACPPSDEASK